MHPPPWIYGPAAKTQTPTSESRGQTSTEIPHNSQRRTFPKHPSLPHPNTNEWNNIRTFTAGDSTPQIFRQESVETLAARENTKSTLDDTAESLNMLQHTSRRHGITVRALFRLRDLWMRCLHETPKSIAKQFSDYFQTAGAMHHLKNDMRWDLPVVEYSCICGILWDLFHQVRTDTANALKILRIFELYLDSLSTRTGLFLGQRKKSRLFNVRRSPQGWVWEERFKDRQNTCF